MIRLNLLSPSKKREIKRKVALTKGRSVLSYSVLVLFILTVFLGGNQFLMEEKISSLDNQIANAKKIAQSSEGSTLDEQISEFNSIVKVASQKLSGCQLWSPILADISTKAPVGVQITYLALTKPQKEVEIRGKSSTRDDLVIFKNNLEEDGDYTNLDIPITSFLQKTDLDFKINFNFGG